MIYQGQRYTQDLFSADSQDLGNLFPTTDVSQRTESHIKSTSQEIRLQNQERAFDIFDYVVGYFDNKNNTPTTLTRPTVVRLPAATYTSTYTGITTTPPREFGVNLRVALGSR